MRRFRSPQLVVLALVALSTWTCSSTSTTPSGNTPITTPVSTTEVFSSPLTANGAVTFSFTTSREGLITISLTSISPDSGLTLGLALGVFAGTSCELKITNDTAPQGTVVSGVGGLASNFCARVYDAAGVVTVPTSVSVTVTHF